MAQSMNLGQRQSQALTMTPQLAQSIKILQLSAQELNDLVAQEVEANPLLELEPETHVSQMERRADRNGEPAKASEGAEGDGPQEVVLDDGAKHGELDASFENVHDGGTAGAERMCAGETRAANASPERDELQWDYRADESLTSHLERQIAVAFPDPFSRKIATYIAHALDEDGYFRESVDETAETFLLTRTQFLEILERFQTLEPVGIGARDLVECLTLQLRDHGLLEPAMESLMANLEKVAKREFASLVRICGVEKEELAVMLKRIRELDPRPAAAYAPILAESVVADVFVKAASDGSWTIDLNPETLPRILVDRSYHSELTARVGKGEERTYLSQCMENANWLQRSLEQRAQTILKVTAQIVRVQDSFFMNGEGELKPMTLKQVADAVNVHESTVSRVTSNKYLACAHGTFELKFFFSAALSGDDGEASHSARSVKHRIGKLISDESSDGVLSDDRLSEILSEEGVQVARRTVAKYREALRIPSSIQRKREKNGMLP